MADAIRESVNGFIRESVNSARNERFPSCSEVSLRVLPWPVHHPGGSQGGHQQSSPKEVVLKKKFACKPQINYLRASSQNVEPEMVT